jgi:saccharopine dehydrogenase-like NADP-dependent oxidoreductase
VKRVLIYGGYGGFGARLARRLVAQGHKVLVAGRSAARGAAFCSDHPGAEAVVADRNGDVAATIATHRPDLVIDAAGPFQGSDYRVALACAVASVPYLDLADARGFVSGFDTLDAAACAGGVALVSGASSVPALSGAVARELAKGLDRVTSVDVAISASNRATAGASVARAILSYVGQPLALWRGGRWARAWGWQEVRRVRFEVAGVLPLEGRWVALADVPDHDVLPEMLPGRPALTFRAGTELAVQTLGLWLLSWPVRWLRCGPVSELAALLLPLQRLTRAFGSDRSAMSVVVKGFAGATGIERRWTLIAADGDGPEIPVLAATLMAERLLARQEAPGARHCGGLLDLAAFEPLFAGLSLRHETVEAHPQPLYRRVMGDAFAALPGPVRAMHNICGQGSATGEAVVTRGRNPITRLVAALVGFPPAGTHALHVGFEETDGVERWIRHFGRHAFHSTLSQCGACVAERFGPLRFHFALPSDGAGLTMALQRWTVFGLPLPRAFAPQSIAREWAEAGRFHFDVPISLPLAGLLVHYTGWLIPDVSTEVSPLPTAPEAR